MRRRSVSSFVSPGPRVPMPPPSRESASRRSGQPRQPVLQLRQLDLQLPFARPRAPREDVENQLGAIDDAPAEDLFEVARLRRRELVVERSRRRRSQLGAGHGRAVSALPRPMNVAASATRRSCVARSTTSAPAARARPASSSRRMSGSTDREVRVTSPTIAARSLGGSFDRAPRLLMLASDSNTRLHGTAPARTSRAGVTRASTIVDGAPPGVGPPSMTSTRAARADAPDLGHATGGCRTARIRAGGGDRAAERLRQRRATR